jgi:VWFA-related protein
MGTLSARGAAGPAPQTFRSAVDVVTIQASVRDARGKVLSGLTATDFEIRDNGEIRPILSLRSDRNAPLSVAILVDMSGSMRIGAKIAMARQAFDSVLAQLRPAQDEAAVFTFDSSIHERVGFTIDIGRLKGALSEFQPFGATSLYDATEETARRLAQRPATHRAIVVLTDGIDTSSALTAADVSGLASSLDVPVYIVATIPAIDQRRMIEASARSSSSEADLRDLAEWSGGRLIFATTLTESVVVATNIVDELRQQYIVAIEASPDREWRRLDVRIKDRSATVKARSGYFGG